MEKCRMGNPGMLGERKGDINEEEKNGEFVNKVHGNEGDGTPENQKKKMGEEKVLFIFPIKV